MLSFLIAPQARNRRDLLWVVLITNCFTRRRVQSDILAASRGLRAETRHRAVSGRGCCFKVPMDGILGRIALS
ncbi:unnamed protein product [Mycena citricolor]|uniref:Uncharacterized protein n=1 Tax=Mycena citricolor TaxID=2018698 RepID=A0AAD2HQV3_9AGAR|nr:unnamed protein product [Mycena citricolor]